MTPAIAPANTALLMSLNAGVATLMERTKDLREMRETVIRTDERVEKLQNDFDAHCSATEAEFRRMRSASTVMREKSAEQKGFVRGRWKGIALACGAFAGLVEAGVHVAKVVFSR